MKRTCLYCGKVIDVRDSHQEPVCKKPSAKCQKLRDDAKGRFAEHRNKEVLSTLRVAPRSEQSERYGPDLRNDDGDITATEDLNKSEVRVEGTACDIDAADEVEKIAGAEIAEAEAAALELDKEQTDEGSEDECEEEQEEELEATAEERFENPPPATPKPRKLQTNDIGPDKKKKSRFSTPAFPVVPSGDPQAPYGRDDDDKPIRPMRTDRDIHLGMLEAYKPSYEPCPHRNDPAHCTICKVDGDEPVPMRESAPVPAQQDLHLAPRDNSDIRDEKDRILHEKRIAKLTERRNVLLASWKVRKESLLKKCEYLRARRYEDPIDENMRAYHAAEDDLRREEIKAFETIEKIANEIAKPQFFLLRKELNISRTTIAEWLDRDEVLRDSWTEMVCDKRRVKREIRPSKEPRKPVDNSATVPTPEQIQNLKRFSRNARKDNPSWDDKRVCQYRRELKKQICELTLLKEQARKPDHPQRSASPERQYEIVVENTPGTEHEIKCYGEHIFIPGDVISYKDMIAFRRPQTHEFDGFENDVIRRACQIGVFKPSQDAVRRFPELAIRVQASNEGEIDTDNQFDHEQQNKSILKGGASGLTVIGAGCECNPRTGRMTPRASGDFNHTRRAGTPSGEGSGPDGESFGGSFGDVDMPADLEGDES